MTLAEAKEFYFQYYGHTFHMDREEPARYNSFRQLDIDKTTLKAWDEELLDRLFKELRNDPERVWINHGNILKIIRRNNCETQKYLDMLADAMGEMGDLDLFQLTLIIENMAGRTSPLKDGGVYVFAGSSKQMTKMKETMEMLIDAGSKNQEADDRFREAVSQYRRACRQWKELKG